MSATEYDVALVVSTAALTLAELARRLGAPPGDGSHDRGEPHLLKTRGVWEDTVWQYGSGCPRTASVPDQFRAIGAHLPSGPITGLLPDDARVYFSVGVFSDAQI